MKKTLFFVIMVQLSVITINACRPLGLCEPEKLSFEKINFGSNQLKIQGYYYGDSVLTDGEYAVKVVLLYKNGIFLNNYPIKLSKFFYDSQLPIVSREVLNNRQDHWGIFKVNNQQLFIEYWMTPFNGCPKIVKEEAEILNDTTFVMKSKNKIYRFRSSTIKPDSTNNFIK
jgi:hypothetical protein